MSEYRKRTMTPLALDRGWVPTNLDALPPGAREAALNDREHLVQEKRQDGNWYAVSTWAMNPSETAARAEVARLRTQAEVIRGKAARPIEAAEASVKVAKSRVEAARREVGAAEDALKALRASARTAEAEAVGIDKQVKEAERELDRLLRHQAREPVAV
jgi:chromosome segregation ATPase